MARLNIGSGASATITNVTGGNIVGVDASSTVTTTNQITGGRCSSVTWLSVPTNTASTRHNMDFIGDDVNLQLTNSGSVAFASTSSGTVTVTAGPPNTLVSEIYDTTSNYFRITSTRTTTDVADNVEQTYEIVSDSVSIASNAAIGDLELTGLARYHPVENADDSVTIYRIGTVQPQTTSTDGTTTTTVDTYAIKIETKADNVIITRGGIDLSLGVGKDEPLPDNGINYTDNVVVQEKPFTVTVTFPEDYGYAAVELPSGTQINTQVDSSYDNTTNFFSITSNSDGDELTYDIVSLSDSVDISDGAISDLKGINRTTFDDRYHQDGGLIYRIGAEDTDGPFTDSSTGNVTSYFTLIEESNVIGIDQIVLTAGDVIKVACVKVGTASFYAEFAVTGDDQSINVVPDIQDYSQTAAIPSGTAVTSVTFDTVTNLLDIICTNVRQEGDVMNNILTESLLGPGTNRGGETVEAMLYFESSDIYRTLNNSIFINSDRVRLTSTTASTEGGKETMAYFNPTTATATDLETKLYLLTIDDDFLGQSIIRTDFTTGDLTNELNRRKVTEGTLLNAQLNIPAFGSDQ